MFDPKTMLLCHALADLAKRLEENPEQTTVWQEARLALAAADAEEEALIAAVKDEDGKALQSLVEGWSGGQGLLPLHDRGVLKRAMKAYRKRLKLNRLDDESRLGGAFSKGLNSNVVAITPPDLIPAAIWEELGRQGRLIAGKHGTYELPPDAP
ncbi:MAG: hypothetical protein ACI9EF_003748 [Pseudohongiellaceae bacterium]|jgi:hypothetical protein